MSGRPGDFMVDLDGTRWFVIECTKNTRTAWKDGVHAVRADGNGIAVDGFFPPLRPLVVVDMDDVDQVERLVSACQAKDFSPYNTRAVGQMRSALREFVKPTPAEPTEVGTWIEDSEGVQYVRIGNAGCIDPWASFRGGLPYRDRYQDIDVTKVLFGGAA